jgi:DNA-binding CsgD family transcriptional regulator
VGPLLRRHGALLLLRDEEAGLAELTEAERLLASGGLRVEHGKALLALGAALLARPVERALAVGLLLQAVEVAEGTSAARLRRGATEALAEAGVAVPALRRAGLAGLSTTRRRIALLAADGVSLREIAESLYLTPRAVEKHLGEVRRRLGIGEGDDLSAALAAAVEAPVSEVTDVTDELAQRR